MGNNEGLPFAPNEMPQFYFDIYIADMCTPGGGFVKLGTNQGVGSVNKFQKGIFIPANTSVHKVCTPVHKSTYRQVIGGQSAVVV